MLVTKRNFSQALKEIAESAKIHGALGFDTETTCLPYWDSPWYADVGVTPRVFSAQFATKESEYYFDFNPGGDDVLGDKHFFVLNAELCANPDIAWFIANAPFDLNHCANHGLRFAGRVHCTKAIARVVNNIEPSLSLDSLGEKYLGVGKQDFAALVKERGFVTQIKKFGHNDKFEEIYHFDKMPLEELVRYGAHDARLAFDLGVWQVKKILEIDKELKHTAPLWSVYENECKLTKVISDMGLRGIKIDRAYTETAYEYEVAEYKKIEGALNKLAGKEVDWLSAKQLQPIFDAANEPYRYTEKGNASFDKEALEDSSSELAKLILQYRFHHKRAHTYFENFIWLADRNDVVHAEAQQSGTKSARMSYWNPNLQNVPKRTEAESTKYKIRGCFVPRPGKVLADFDYYGAEYVMGIDYAREMTVVKQLNEGLDPHADLAARMYIQPKNGISARDLAKTMQFRIFYGAWYEAIGRALGFKGLEAKQVGKTMREAYFANVPLVAGLIERVKATAESRGYIFNWFGRVLKYDRNTSYTSFNGMIQGGVGDMTKIGMVRLSEQIPEFEMLIQVHDSVVGELPLNTGSVFVEPIKHILASVYPFKVIQMKASGAYSLKSWAELEDKFPSCP